jgi:sulfotransferase
MAMRRKIHFISGLPRSGSTLLANILAQNPRFEATATSGILDVLFRVRNSWDKIAEFRAMVDQEACEAAKVRVLRSILASFHGRDERPVVFDKSRGWLGHLEMAEALLERPAKVLVPVRDIRDVLASFERLWRQSAGTRQLPIEHKFYVDFQTIEGRCNAWARPEQPVGIAYNRIKDAILRGFAERMHFVRFEELTRRPRETLQGIYEFLDEPDFEHDFDHVEQVTAEDDRVFGIPELHTIRTKVEPVPPQWPKYLGEIGNRYASHNFW